MNAFSNATSVVPVDINGKHPDVNPDSGAPPRNSNAAITQKFQRGTKI
jgi:hypothetical protein